MFLSKLKVVLEKNSVEFLFPAKQMQTVVHDIYIAVTKIVINLFVIAVTIYTITAISYGAPNGKYGTFYLGDNCYFNIAEILSPK